MNLGARFLDQNESSWGLEPYTNINPFLLTNSQVAGQLTLRLLWNFTDQRPSPPLTGSIVYSAYSYLFAKTGSSPSSEAHPIADRSVLVLLLLHSQSMSNPNWKAFKTAIQSIRDERGTYILWPQCIASEVWSYSLRWLTYHLLNTSLLGSMADDQKDDTIFVSFRKVFHIVCQ